MQEAENYSERKAASHETTAIAFSLSLELSGDFSTAFFFLHNCTINQSPLLQKNTSEPLKYLKMFL